MARTVAEIRIQDRTARGRLAVRQRPYWRMLSEGAHLGYRRGALKGSWIARLRATAGAAYVTRVIGEADDKIEADGEKVLNWKQAMARALAWIEEHQNGPAPLLDPDMTVGSAARSYIEARDARRTAQAGRPARSDAYYKLTKHVLADDALPTVKLRDLNEAHLRAWQSRVARRQASSVQRVLNELKAALNNAFEVNRRALPSDFPVTVKFGLKYAGREGPITQARENQILTDDQVRRVVAAALAIDEDFGMAVVLLAATGARFIQLARMKVGDVQPEFGRVLVPQSFKGKKRQVGHVRVQVGQDTLAVLREAVEGRPTSAPLLERWRMRQIEPTKWVREFRGAWTSASELTRMWKRAIASADLPASTIPYALRHSSIVRGLRLGLPIRLVAALHDTSVGMIERHYARWITEGLDELAARSIVPLISVKREIK